MWPVVVGFGVGGCYCPHISDMGVTYWSPSVLFEPGPERRFGIWGSNSNSKFGFRVWIQGSEFGILFLKKIEFYLRSIVTKIKVCSIGNITYFFSDIMTNDLEKDPRVYVSRLYYSGGASVVLFAFRRDEFGGFMPMAGIIQRHKLKIKLWL